MKHIPAISRWAVAVLLLGVALASWWYAVAWFEATFPSLNQNLRDFWNHPYLTLGNFGLTLAFLVKAALFLALLWIFTRVLSSIFRTQILDKTALGEGRKFSLQRLTSYTFFTVGAVTGLNVLGIDLSSLTLFSGALGIGLGLGFQPIVKNFASGLILLVEQPVKVGDRVQVDDLQGDILHIESRATWVRTNENVVMIVPNSEFIEGRVTNWTANDRNVRINVPLGVSYGSDPEQVRAVLMRVATDHPDVLDDPEPDVIFTGFGDSSIDFEIRVWTSRQVTTPKIIASDLYFALFAAFKQEGIEIPFPQRDLHLRSVAPTVLDQSAGRNSGGDPDPDEGARHHGPNIVS